jgi:hypothetical protein
MVRKLSRNHSLSVVAPFIAILILLIAAVVLAQVPGAGPMDSNTPLFLAPISYDAHGFQPEAVAVADLNGDGKPDLVVANMCDNNRDSACAYGTRPGIVAVILGNGDGTFQPAVTYRSGGNRALSVAIADLNGDGKPDLVVLNDLTPPVPCASLCSNVSVLLGRGDGTFQPAVTYSSGNQIGYNVVIADLNGDGKPDLVVSGSRVSMLLGRGDGTFQPAATFGPDTRTAAVADVNHDGIPDIVAACDFSVCVLLGNGDGTFQPAVTYDSGGTQPESIAVADLNGDGNPDVVVTNYMSANIGVLLGNGDGTFQPAVTYGTGGQPFKVAVADVNGDGKPDLAVACIASGNAVLLGNGDGSLQSAVFYRSGGGFPGSVAIADVNGDGAPDLLVADWAGGPRGDGLVSVLLNTSGPRNATVTALVPSANPVALTQTVTYTATVTSQSGGTVDGTVMFRDGFYVIGKATLAGNQAQYSTSYSTVTDRLITALYAGNKDNAGSISSQLLEESRRTPFVTHTAVSTSGSPSFIVQAVTLTATVTCGTDKIPDGELVTFYDGTTPLNSVALAGGVATYTTSSLAVRTHLIKAIYAGDATFLTSTGGITQVVIRYPTTTTLGSSLNPTNYGQSVTLTAKVTSAGPAPTGTVTFRNGSVILGTQTLNGSGIATLTTAKIPVGADSLTAAYNGDASNGKSVSAAITQTVRRASIHMALTSYPNPSAFGTSVTFTAKLTSNGGLPSGQPVTFSYNGVTLGTANVNSKGVATFSTTALPRGSDLVTAAYAGTVDYSAASATVTQVVN